MRRSWYVVLSILWYVVVLISNAWYSILGLLRDVLMQRLQSSLRSSIRLDYYGAHFSPLAGRGTVF